MPQEVPIENLWRNRIAPALGLPLDASISEVPEGFGIRVYLVATESASYVLRVYPARSHSRMRNYLRANRYFRETGFVVPKTIGEGGEGETAWLLEEKLEGRDFRDLLAEPDAIRQAAHCLARLHDRERGRYGEVGTWGGFRLTLRWRQRFAERWSKIVRLLPELEPLEGEVETWFQDWTDSFSPERYQLLHGDFYPGNLCLHPGGEVAFLDLRTPRFGFGLLETLEALHHFTGEDPADWPDFVFPYLDGRGEETGKLWEDFGESLHAVFHLRQADRFADLAVGERGTLDDRRRWERNAWDSWQRFARLTGIVGPEVEIAPETAFPSRGRTPPLKDSATENRA